MRQSSNLVQTVRSILENTSVFELPRQILHRLILVNSVFVALFLMVFQPFQLYRSSFSDLVLVALITAVTIFSVQTLTMSLARRWIYERALANSRRLLVESVVSATVILAVGLILFATRVYAGRVPFTLTHGLLFIGYALLLAPFLVLSTRVFIVLRVLSALSSRPVEARPMPEAVQANTSVTIRDPEGQPLIECASEHFLFAKSEGNYVKVTCEQQGSLRTSLLRCTLSSFTQQVAEFPFVMPCHRSYLVNLSKVTSVVRDGSARSLKMLDIDLLIPVSRSRFKEVKSTLQNVAGIQPGND